MKLKSWKLLDLSIEIRPQGLMGSTLLSFKATGILSRGILWQVFYFSFESGYFSFESGSVPVGWNATAMTLVPKVAAPQSIKDYRPIAWCITVYKCITKILANRCQAVLPSIIGPSQSAFIKGRSIMDNTLLMQELVRDYHRDPGPPRCAIKLDIMKAYDRVDWDFLIAAVTYMEFPLQFIHWVSACASTPWFSIVINGELKGFFLGRRGFPLPFLACYGGSLIYPAV